MREVEQSLVVDQIAVIQSDGYTKVTGLGPGDFAPTLWDNGTVSAATVSVVELGGGEYQVSFTPDALGHWILDLAVPSLSIRVRREYMIVEVLTNTQAGKLDRFPTVGPSGAMSGSLLDRLVNRDSGKTYSQATDSLEALRDRIG